MFNATPGAHSDEIAEKSHGVVVAHRFGFIVTWSTTCTFTWSKSCTLGWNRCCTFTCTEGTKPKEQQDHVNSEHLCTFTRGSTSTLTRSRGTFTESGRDLSE